MTSLIKCFVCVFLVVLTVGCGDTPDQTVAKPETGHAHEHGHSDELVWPKKDIEFEGYVVTLGHHGSHFHAGDSIEPAIMLTKDGEDIGDAKTSCSLLDAGGNSLAQADMIYEPKTDEEPAHYAQGELKFPAEPQTYKIEFTVMAGDKEFKDSIKITIDH